MIELYGRQAQEDDTNAIAQMLRQLSSQLDPQSLSAASPPPSKPDVSSIILAVKALWFLSLLLTLSVAFFAIFTKQWYQVYGHALGDRHSDEVTGPRPFYMLAFRSWHLIDIINALPILLQVAVLLFVIGLVFFLWIIRG
jgi:hypothetical protein